MPGGPPETLAQAKRTLKGMFRKKSKNETDFSNDPGSMYDTTSSTKTPRVGETQTDESTSPHILAENTSKVDGAPQITTSNKLSTSSNMVDDVDDAGTAAAASMEISESSIPKQNEEMTATNKKDYLATSDMAVSSSQIKTDRNNINDPKANPIDIPISSHDRQKSESNAPSSATSPIATTSDLPHGHTPPMSATSGPLEDNPILT